MGSKHTICVDFDGVLHSYASGWKGACIIPDPPVDGAMAWLVEAARDPRLEVCVYSSRSKEPDAIDAMKRWLDHHLVLHFAKEKAQGAELDPASCAMAVVDALQFPTQKPAANMTIDDRAFCFGGRFPPIEWIVNFKPWNKRGPEHEHAPVGARAETGVVQFGDDWPGVYLRGDDAGPFGFFLQQFVEGVRSGRQLGPFETIQIESWAGVLRGCEVHEGQKKTVLRPFEECLPAEPETRVCESCAVAHMGEPHFGGCEGGGCRCTEPQCQAERKGARMGAEDPEDDPPSEHQILVDAVLSLVEAIYPDFAGYLPDAVDALAKAVNEGGGVEYLSREKLNEALWRVSR